MFIPMSSLYSYCFFNITVTTVTETAAEGSLPIGGIVGGSLAAVLIVVIVIVSCIWIKRKQSKQVCIVLFSNP